MRHIYLSLGSNLGNRFDNLAKARDMLTAEAGQVKAVSAVFETEPWGHTSERTFYNQALELDTELSPLDLLHTLQGIEKQCGRVRPEVQYAARTIDIDILFYGNTLWESDCLVIPHPLMHLRRFVLLPLADIAPLFIHPLMGISIKDLLVVCPDDKRILQRLKG